MLHCVPLIHRFLCAEAECDVAQGTVDETPRSLALLLGGMKNKSLSSTPMRTDREKKRKEFKPVNGLCCHSVQLCGSHSIGHLLFLA